MLTRRMYMITVKSRLILLIPSNVPVAQWLEHCVSSAKVVGSIPREQTY